MRLRLLEIESLIHFCLEVRAESDTLPSAVQLRFHARVSGFSWSAFLISLGRVQELGSRTMGWLSGLAGRFWRASVWLLYGSAVGLGVLARWNVAGRCRRPPTVLSRWHVNRVRWTPPIAVRVASTAIGRGEHPKSDGDGVALGKQGFGEETGQSIELVGEFARPRPGSTPRFGAAGPD